MPKKILIINIFGIGDVLFTTPLISNIKASFPDAFIGYVCNTRAKSVLENNPKINKIFIFERDEYKETYGKSKRDFIQKIFSSLHEIKKEQFDIVLDFSLSSHVNFFMWLIGIKNRIGFNYKNRSFLLTKKIPLEGYENKHVVDYYLGLLKEIGVSVKYKELEIFSSKEDEVFVQNIFNQNSLKSDDVLVALVPGGGASWGKDAIYKRWPPEKYAQLADKIIDKFAAKVILLGDSFEQALCQKVAQSMQKKVIDLSSKTTVGQLAALFKKCRLVIVNDGGPLHVAVAAKARTVSIFGPVDDRVYGPYLKGNHLVVSKDIACRPCYRRFRKADCEHHHCLHLITPSDVLEKVEQVL